MHCGNGQIAVQFLYGTVQYKVPPSTSEEMEMWMLQTNSLKMQSQKIDRPSWIAIPAIHHQQTRKRLPKIPEEKEKKKWKGGNARCQSCFCCCCCSIYTLTYNSAKDDAPIFGWMLGRGRESHRLATTSRRGDSHFFPLFFFLLLFTPGHFGGQT